MKKACNCWAVVYVLVIFLILPLYVENGYFNIVEAKRHIFIIVAVALIPVGLAMFIIAAARKNIKPLKVNALDIMMISMAVVSLVSCLLSADIMSSFWGYEGWGIGAFTWISLTVSYFLVSRCLIYNHNIWLPVIAVNIVIIFIAILQAADLDPLALHKGMVHEQIYSYFSTIGNSNWWTGYLCLLIPMMIVFLIQSETMLSKITYLVFWAALSFGILISATDGIFVGLGFCAFLIVPLLCRNSKGMETLGWLAVIFGAVLLIFASLPCFSSRVSELSGITKKMYIPWVGAVVLAFGFVIFVLFRLFGDRFPAVIFKAITIIFEAALVVTAVIFLISTIRNFGNEWGTSRGWIWKGSVLIFESFTPKEKLIGLGPEMQSSFYALMPAWLNRPLKVSHSEPLQYLLSMGLAGVCCWYGIWVCIVLNFIKERKNAVLKTAFFLSLMAYFAQAHLNSAMTTNMAILFMFFCFSRMPENKTA